jgi:hypothetical protein
VRDPGSLAGFRNYKNVFLTPRASDQQAQHGF